MPKLQWANTAYKVTQAFCGYLGAQSLPHAGGAAKVLKCRGNKPATDTFSKTLLLSLRGPVVSKDLALAYLSYDSTLS